SDDPSRLHHCFATGRRSYQPISLAYHDVTFGISYNGLLLSALSTQKLPERKLMPCKPYK
ncbi:MAG: hypothetical protein U1C48_10775, partial [Methylotenera sp.]|nr:hypothetical protein [Methylotenera sp.]